MAEPTAVAETERKYEADRSVDLGSAISAEHGTPERQRLRAVYYDTADLRLLRARVTLRRREGGHDAGWHLKLPADGDTRLELRLPLDEPPADGPPANPPEELLAPIRAHTGDRPLGPVARLDTDRKRWVLTDDQLRELAELTEDDVDARTLGPLAPRSVTWREYEVELGAHGSLALLDRIERTLLDRGARRSDTRSKVGRLLGPDALR
jgi:inorganic triphosphatase YgiF